MLQCFAGGADTSIFPSGASQMQNVPAKRQIRNSGRHIGRDSGGSETSDKQAQIGG